MQTGIHSRPRDLRQKEKFFQVFFGSLNALYPISTKTGGDNHDVNFHLPAGDANNDNGIDIGDFGILVGAFGSVSSDPLSGYDNHADFNEDGSVDIEDFGILVNNYGTFGDL